MSRPVKLAALLTVLLVPGVLHAQATSLTSDQLRHLRFRQPGPAVAGGRIHDVEALPDDPATIYVASATGGIWKSINKGTTWRPIFEGQPVSNFGDIAIAPSNPDVIWAGTGGQNNRQSTSWGNGVYRSTDGGDTWTHLGLDNTRHVGRVRAHPTNSDIAYVAALGNLWRPSADRGVYRTTNGGRTWDKVLFIDTHTGVVDLVMDPLDPDILYAAAYQRLRRPWGFNGGGPGSGIYKTTDGGQNWRELTNGLPAGDKGRIGLGIAQTNGSILYATVEHAELGGTYRSADGGETWRRVNQLNQRPMYYSHIFVDPSNENRIYEVATSFYRSNDGGRNFRTMPVRPTYDVGVHSDFHTMWINPNNAEHFYLAGDGGLHETWDGGETYSKIANLPIAQYYAIGVDHREPYNIYGGLQDNHSWMGPSATRRWIGIINDDWRQVGFGDGMYHQPDPTNPRYEYGSAQGGSMVRLDSETGDLLDIQPTAMDGERYRFDWTAPILISRHDSRTIYFGGNRLFVSHNRGDSWDRTEDLTKQIDRDTLTLMGVRGSDITLSRNDGTSSYSELTTIAESPLDPNVLWVGSDDGNIQVSRDGAGTWTEVSRNILGQPSHTYVSRVVASATGPGTAYVTLDAHRDGDFAPYVYRTEDFGRSWTALTNGLPSDGSVNVIVEHPQNPNLLFLGTERALFASLNRGAEWVHFESNLPTTPYDDMVIHPRDDDLVLGTHGRSLWILDDVSPLAEWSPEIADSTVHLFSVRPASIKQFWKDTSYRSQAAYAGENPPDGVLLSYVTNLGGNVTIEIADSSGAVIRRWTEETQPGQIHRSVWDLRHVAPPTIQQFGESQEPTALLPHPTGTRGPFVSPGSYTAQVTTRGARSTQSVEIRGDPMMTITQTQYEEREAFLQALVAAQREASEMTQRVMGNRDMSVRLRNIQRQLGRLYSSINGSGVRQGSLFPPTTTQRQRWQAAQAELDQLRRELAVSGG